MGPTAFTPDFSVGEGSLLPRPVEGLREAGETGAKVEKGAPGSLYQGIVSQNLVMQERGQRLSENQRSGKSRSRSRGRIIWRREDTGILQKAQNLLKGGRAPPSFPTQCLRLRHLKEVHPSY